MINSKEDLFQTICNASRLGNLGFFIGAGFSKAMLDGNKSYSAYRWGELLGHVCEKLGIDKTLMEDNSSYPEIATKICKNYADKEDITYNAAVHRFKSKICELTNTYPEKEQRENYEKWFKKIEPSWIVTTNYDMLIESVLGGTALPISPNGYFCNINGMIPVFHLHGMCNDPEGIIITNEDYAHMFRPNDYRQARLPFLMKESCVLMIGYGLGDINVITALDWANNVYTNVIEGYEFPIIQLIYSDMPKPTPYLGQDNIILYEIKSLDSFFNELCDYMEDYVEKYLTRVKFVSLNIAYMSSVEEQKIIDFVDNKDEGKVRLLEFFANLEPEFGYAYNSFYLFLRAVFAKLDELSIPSGEFEPYNKKLKLILDILMSVPYTKMPPSFWEMLANELNEVGYYVEPNGKHIAGKSYSATDTWKNQKDKIPDDIKEELWRFHNSNKYDSVWLKQLLESI